MITVYLYHHRFLNGEEFAVYANREDAEHAAHATPGAEIISCPLILSDSSRKTEPAKIEVPGICFACDASEIKSHCNNKKGYCFWVKCRKCLATSAVLRTARVYVLPNGERHVRA